ncbi:glutamate-5-semialdehyde dehydrogenase [Aerococcus urinae]|uniref:Gamma-glutamyl phosphate reductase n=1 Tax=Aerococcus urinae TaxID=1376 RepID=A0A109RE77_9LACT|nr:glutamate-5-semialdehyde dehydrogenase [Aerococcus urinae]AMB95318.1 gamma-glutamyl-phosphate reductase [Aerococcus urinae]MCY3032043.1 glutamate-5-semialdehyde dehydrogenase [Aerococcus urinae]MCY3036965.1 glutamate-5-semialdehyde dehydrogenase [Aerococcus urinae]MCY3044089.1 glutamate-5-semialdehyde dehydrogenase [Aerococcus urinae]MCY3046890.1 glutamate-5-semialdehyde dehydrogenase [Aerococcus urinae]
MINSADLVQMGQEAKAAARQLSNLPRAKKDQALVQMAESLRNASENILQTNQTECQKAQEQGLKSAFVERMTLNPDRIEAMAQGLEKVAQLDDPINHVDEMWVNENGLKIGKRRVPLGVIGIIYESRPNVSSDAAGLCFKTGNAVILRGGKETIQTNQAIVHALQEGLEAVDLPKAAIQFIDNPSHDLAGEMMTMNDSIDCLIPRGSKNLIQRVVQTATIPTIETGVGNCHLYVHEACDFDMALKILINGKAQRVSVCNALETLLVDQAIAKDFLPLAGQALKDHQVKIHGDQVTADYIDGVIPATAADYDEEYLDYEIAIKVVKDYQEAVDHIAEHSSHHSEAIVTNDYAIANRFMDDVDSACVYVNASTRFTDGEVFGFGGEIGISTQKLHARGPMGLEALTSYKYTIFGQGQIRE